MFARPWAFWRRTQYVAGIMVFLSLVSLVVYAKYFYEPANCFDGLLNGDERGIDCGGGCVRICAIDVLPPKALWAQSFRVTDGQYNAVAYIENKNLLDLVQKLQHKLEIEMKLQLSELLEA